MHDKINNISTIAVMKATGRGWDEWIEFLDHKNAWNLTHREIAKMLFKKGFVKNDWWG